MIVGIDATNIKTGGGLTHLSMILKKQNLPKFKNLKIIVWSNKKTLKYINSMKYIKKISVNIWKPHFVFRLLWHIFFLKRNAKKQKCDILFFPGGTFFGKNFLYVTLSQNLLPFFWNQIKKYIGTFFFIKLILLRYFQIKTFSNSAGLIFLDNYAKKIVTSNLKKKINFKIIPHGVNKLFFDILPKQKSIYFYKKKNNFNIVCTSTIDLYKHQWNVIKAIYFLKKKTNFNLKLHIVGDVAKPAEKIFFKYLKKYDPNQKWTKYYKYVSQKKLSNIYSKSNIAIFPSSCENLPNILIEKMAAGLPVACSKNKPMPQILGKYGSYFDPENYKSIMKATHNLIMSRHKRISACAYNKSKAKKYSWKISSRETFKFLKKILIINNQHVS